MGHGLDDLPHGLLEIVGHLVHVGTALLRHHLVHGDLGLRLLAGLLGQHDLDLVDGLGGLADLVTAAFARDRDLLALGHPLQHRDQRPHRLGNAELPDHKAQRQTEHDAERGHRHQHARGLLILILGRLGEVVDAGRQSVGNILHLRLELLGIGAALQRGIAHLLSLLADLHVLGGGDDAERLLHALDVLVVERPDIGDHGARLIILGLGDLLQALGELLALLLDHLQRRLAILVTRIERGAELGAVERNHVLIGACRQESAVGGGLHQGGAFGHGGQRVDGEPADRTGHAGHQDDDRKNLGEHTKAGQQRHR